MFILRDGTEVTKDQIETAFEAGQTRLVHNHACGHTTTNLMLNGVDVDSRGLCYSVWEELWTTLPDDLQSALKAASY